MFSVTFFVGILVSVFLAILAVWGGLSWLAWVALVPAILALIVTYQRRLALRERELADRITQSQEQSTAMASVSAALHGANEALQHQVETLTSIRNATLALGTVLDQQALLQSVTQIVTTQLHYDRVLILIVRPEHETLTFGAISQPAALPDDQFRLEQLEIPLSEDSGFAPLAEWQRGRSVLEENAGRLYGRPFGWIFSTLRIRSFFSVPLRYGDELLGVIIVDNPQTGRHFGEEDAGLLEALAANISIALQNARLYRHTDEQLSKHVQELDIMRQVDRELMEALSWERVLNMILDWALRLTGAHAASLALVDAQKRILRLVAGYGLDIPEDDLRKRVLPMDQGVMGRVARTGSPALLTDVRQEADYIPLTKETISYLSVPIRRRGRVIAVLNMESPHPDAFDSSHQDFVERLANHASVALDNARLFEETQRERQKLSSIVEKTADIIIVVGFDRRLILLNEAALAAFRLDPREEYTGRDFLEVFAETPLAPLGERFLGRAARNVHIVEEVTLEGQRYFHTDIAANEQVGWLIVMHDVTPFKETERLKNELIATVSHDLKNPLSVINGYIELLSMYNELNPRGQEFMAMIRRSIHTMRQLIDDLLDMAHIDAGMEIRPEPILLPEVIHESVIELLPLAEEKRQRVTLDVPQDLPPVAGDERRLRQIIVNLVSNAIKYTPPEGTIRVMAYPRDDRAVQISIEDNGLGISPEDQAQIFERFYRVRRPETDAIEGTGLGLAIVKGLVEAHGGELGLKSHLGEGSTFYFTVPVAADQPQSAQPLPHAG